MNARGPKLYIFDVDGTLRWTHTPGRRFPLSPDDWSLMPNVANVLRAIPWSPDGPWLALASNQPGAGEGLLSASEARDMIAATVRAAIGYIPPRAHIQMCTCPDGSDCTRHKPRPGMLLDALRRFDVPASEGIYVGDQSIDAEAARFARIPFAWAHAYFGWAL
jgi:HAD superfamily hydrolase (TIGR01662 family)